MKNLPPGVTNYMIEETQSDMPWTNGELRDRLEEIRGEIDEVEKELRELHNRLDPLEKQWEKLNRERVEINKELGTFHEQATGPQSYDPK